MIESQYVYIDSRGDLRSVESLGSMSKEMQVIAFAALHKLGIEIGRGTASPRCEYDQALARLDEMKAQLYA